MKKIVVGLILIGLFTQSSYAGKYGTAVTQGRKAKITFRALDDEQNPVAKVNVQAGFYYSPEKQGIIVGETDTNGLCAVEGITCMDMWYSAEKSGYYKTEGRYVFGMVEPPVIDNRWQPWNPTNTVALRRIKNPIPMYVKSVRIKIPVADKTIGFDLEKGDWIAPYGNGVNPDFLFLLNRNRAYENDFECSLQVTFPNEEDGLQEIVAKPVSENSLRLPYVAPQTGYSAEWKREIFMKPDGARQNLETRTDQNYMFRIRAVLDKNKEVKSALYGKIYGDINYYGYIADKVTLVFTYYLNPMPNDRNLEFDPNKNLFGGRDRFAP